MDYKVMLTNKYLREINAKFYLCKKMNDGRLVAQKRHRLSDRQVQMARELGLNPDKLGKIDNHRQEVWKAPLPQFIESIYFKRFKREEPETVKPLKQIMAEMEAKKKLQKEKKKERKMQQETGSDII
jgi:hypothetical protein